MAAVAGEKFPESTQRLMEAAFKGKEAAVPKFVKWMIAAGAADYTDVAAVGGAEKFEVEYIEVMKSDNLDEVKTCSQSAVPEPAGKHVARRRGC